jgi:hypothetical protein
MAEDPVGLTVASKRWGYGLMMVQDHHYQPRYTDAWTLMTTPRTPQLERLATSLLNITTLTQRIKELDQRLPPLLASLDPRSPTYMVSVS